MSALALPLALVALAFLVLAVIAVKYPQGRRDWPLGGRSTAYLLVSLVTLVALLVTSYLALQGRPWPPIVWSVTALAAVVLALAAVAALLLPRGVPRA